jgi:lipopolysaccharide/colanic/teichoic acid biosynthesis glycosyltransferase
MIMTKRVFDLTVGLALLILTAPVMLLAACLVKWSSRGPILFSQERIGRYGKPFRILKFRTMHVVPDGAAPQITIGADPRITTAGHLLRQTKIDELPQLFNVLAGEMSLVGPRPDTAQYVALYPANLREEILAVRPGITDRASIKYRNEAELLALQDNPDQYYREIILPDKLAMGVAYARSHSLRADLAIIFDTIRIVAKPKIIG